MDILSSQRPVTREAVAAFVCFVLSDRARRPSVRGRRQEFPLQGRSVSYGVKVQFRRGSDRSERVYVSVAALEKGGLSNYQACCEVAGRLESELGKSRRGRPRTHSGSPEFADKVETVRSIYNRFKIRHPWKEKLPEQDLVYEQWCSRFYFFQQWAADVVLSAVRQGWSGQKFAEELALRRTEGSRNNYQALRALGADGLVACLNSWLRQKTDSQLARTKVQTFVREFFDWKA